MPGITGLNVLYRRDRVSSNAAVFLTWVSLVGFRVLVVTLMEFIVMVVAFSSSIFALSGENLPYVV